MSEHHPIETLREHLPHHHKEETLAPRQRQGEEPVPGYDSFSVSELFVEFHRHTQAELDACEAYERNNLNREAVLNKIKYMHTRQPWPGYDEMSEDEILARLEDCDDDTVKHVRDYERKFGRRPQIHETAMRVHHERLASAPAEKPPAYQAGGGSFDNL